MARIVVVEDDGALRSDLADRLTGWGHRVMEAADGRQGFTAISQFQPDLVLSDVNMPMSSGIELVELVTAPDSQLTDTIFLFISSDAAPSDVVNGIRCGADDFISKPIDYELLNTKIDSHLRRRNNTISYFNTTRFLASIKEAMTFGTILVSTIAVLGVVCILMLYLLKTGVGLNIFQDIHFSDLF